MLGLDSDDDSDQEGRSRIKDGLLFDNGTNKVLRRPSENR